MHPILQKISFTHNESKVIIFSAVLLLSGLLINFISGKQAEFKAPESFNSDVKFRGYYNSRTSSGINIITTEAEETIIKNEIAADSLKTESKKKKTSKEDKLAGIQININTASKEQLIMLPGVGESTADKIIMYRENHNGFRKIEDIMKIKGIGKKKFEKLKPYIKVE
ncbi:MAG: helix-hairpin-helix domain-containing protein [Ignavibacteria bacterium]|jgi:comEA protein|nr:helix-hairpin-helix domain-containing protein [Ignavibacteria bacterium]